MVGQHGYADATIARVTKVAGIAQGTFYLYFDSRQALLDALLPHFGQEMLDFIRRGVAGARHILEKEERGFRAFLDYMKLHPAFFRILSEAAGAAPHAHATHFALVTDPYVRSLQRALDAGEIKNFASSELEALAYMLMAMREYLYLQHIKSGDGGAASVEACVQVYMKFVRGGLSKE